MCTGENQHLANKAIPPDQCSNIFENESVAETKYKQTITMLWTFTSTNKGLETLGCSPSERRSKQPGAGVSQQ